MKKRSAFTLVEILIVIAILGILAAISIQQYSQYQKRPKHAAVQASLRDLALAQENYYHYVTPNMYTKDIDKLIEKGFVHTPNVAILILSSDGYNWLAKARYIGTPEVFTYDSQNGGLQSVVELAPY